MILFSAFSPSKSVSQLFALCHSMDRFVSKRSSSSVDLDSASRDEVRAERAAIALSVGLRWPPDRCTKQTRERALQDHILDHHELPHGVRLQRLVCW